MSVWFRCVFAVLLACSLTTAAQESEPESADEPAVEVAPEEETREVRMTPVRVPGIDRSITIVDFEAPSLGRRMKYMVLLPENYDASEAHYPVLYLLHGFSQNYTVFPRMGVPQYTADKDLIVVMPDAGNSWYINWASSEGEALNNWADYVTYDLIENVDAMFRTVPRRIGRAISGVSMGGFGAMALGLRRPDLFITVASHSGTLNFARNARLRLEAGDPPQRNYVPPEGTEAEEGEVPEIIAISGFTYQHERYPDGVAFTTPDECRAFDPFELIGLIPPPRLPHLYIDCATGDNLLEDARQFADVLRDNDVPFTYAQSPGQHGVRYWTRELAQSIAVQYSIMRNMLNRVPDPLSLPNTENAAPPGMHTEHAMPPGHNH